jgi:hypothetical protein
MRVVMVCNAGAPWTLGDTCVFRVSYALPFCPNVIATAQPVHAHLAAVLNKNCIIRYCDKKISSTGTTASMAWRVPATPRRG